MSSIRLDRYLADLHIGSRKQIKEYIREARIRVNGETVRRADTHVDPAQDEVSFDDRKLVYSKFRYLMLYKPEGVVTATKDGLSRTVIDLLKDIPVRGLFPVGRLDKDTSGLLLITDDGELAHRLTAPSYGIEKTYEVHLREALSDEALTKLTEGVDIGDDTKTLPAKAKRLPDDRSGRPVILLTIREGRFHQVKRMIHALENEVLSLKRVSMGVLSLDDTLASGAYRYLSADEIAALKESAKGR